MTDPTNPLGDVPDHLREGADHLAPGRADWLRAASAAAAGDEAGVVQVLAELSTLHPAAWQTTLMAGLREFVELLIAVHHGDESAAVTWLNDAAFAAIGFSESVAKRRERDNPDQV